MLMSVRFIGYVCRVCEGSILKFSVMLWNTFIFSFRCSQCLSLQMKDKNENLLAG